MTATIGSIHIYSMNTHPSNASDTPADTQPSRRSIGIYITTLVMLVMILLFWRDLARSKEFLQNMADQNARLSQELAAAQAELEDFKTGDSRKPAQLQPEKTAPKVEEPVAVLETLSLQSPTVTTSAAGLTARISFKPTTPDIPDLMALVVRLPNETEAVIVALEAVQEKSYSNVKSRIDGSGKFAVFQGLPADIEALQFNLTVSAPVTATVRGSKGIAPFEIDIVSGSPAVRTL